MPRRPALALLALLAASAAGATPPPGGVADLIGARGLGLGASIALTGTADAAFVNPAADAAQQRYSIDALYLADRRGSANAGQYLGAGVADSLSSPVAASFAYVRSTTGAQAGSILYGGLATAVAPGLYLGAQAHALLLDGAAPVRVVTADAGLLWQVASLLTVGAAGYNLIPVGQPIAAPRGLGAGLAIGNDTAFKVAGDYRADLVRDGHTTSVFGGGLEALLGGMVPVRGGIVRDQTLGTSWWSAGLGLVTPDGFAVDVGYRQSIESPDARIVGVSIKKFILN